MDEKLLASRRLGERILSRARRCRSMKNRRHRSAQETAEAVLKNDRLDTDSRKRLLPSTNQTMCKLNTRNRQSEAQEVKHLS